MAKFNKKTLISILVLLILLISIPVGIYLSQKTTIFKPRANYTSVGTNPGGICGDPQNYSISSACVNGSPDLQVRWSVPQIQGTDSCNVFISFIDQNVGKNYSISKQCSGSQIITTLTDLDGVNPQVPVREGVNYALNVSNGDTNGCYNIPITNTNTRQCTTPSPSPSSVSFFTPVTGWSEADLRRYRSLGFYPVQESNGDIDLLTRQQFVEYICNNNDACVPKESPTLYSTKNSGVFLQNLLSKLWDHGYAPIPTLRPYFMADLDELISLRAHPSVLDAIKNDNYNIIGVPLTDSSQWQRKTIISPDELKQIIIETARSDEYRSDVLYKYANELRADEEYPILNSLLDAYDPIFGVRAAVTFFALAADQQSSGTRIKGTLGMISVLFPGVGRSGWELSLSTFQKLKVTSQALKMGEVLNLVNSGFTKQVGNLQVVSATLVERTLAEADRVSIPVVNGVSYLSSRVFSTTRTLGRATGWGDDSNRLLGFASDAFGQITERIPVSPNPISDAERYYVLGSAQEQRWGIIDFLNVGRGFMVSNAYVVRPVVENTLAVSDWVARRLRKAQLSSNIKSELRARTDKNLTFAMNDEWFDYIGDPPWSGGFAQDDFIVLRTWVHQSADGMRQYAHEMTHRLANVTASVLGRVRDIGYVSQDMSVIYQKIANNVLLSKDDIFTILFELGTDLHSVAANAIRSNLDLSAELLIAELRNTGYGQSFQQFYTAVLNQYRGTGKDDILVYLLEFAETSDARQFIQRLGSIREFQNFVAGTGSIYVSQGDAVVLMEFMKTQGIDLKRLVPFAAPVVTGAGLFGGLYYTTVNSSRPVGPQLNYNNAIASSSPSPQRTVTNVFVNYNTLTGGGTDIMNVSSAQAFNLNRNDLCLASRAQNLLIGVKYSQPIADGADTKIFTIRFKMPEGSSVCSSSGGISEALAIPSSFSHQCLNNNTVARVSWSGNGEKYDIRVKGEGANFPSRDCAPNLAVCVNGYSGSSIDFTIRPNIQYEMWAHSCKGKECTSDTGRYNFQCPNPNQSSLINPPKLLDGSCNLGSLALSWEKVDGAVKYQMRGKKIYPEDGPNYKPSEDPNVDWRANVRQEDLISNGDGSKYFCSGNVCSMSYNALNPDSKYKVWVNAVDSAGNRSVNSYWDSYVDCGNPPENQFGTNAQPQNVTASCDNGIMSVNWNVVLQDTRIGRQIIKNNILGWNFPVRGFQINPEDGGERYYPPVNWLDGFDISDTTKILYNGKGSVANNVVSCSFKNSNETEVEATSTYQCKFTDSVKRKGYWRVWVTAKGAIDNYQSRNGYIPGLTNCDTIQTQNSSQTQAQSVEETQKTVSAINLNNQSLDLSGNSLFLTFSATTESVIPVQIRYSNGEVKTASIKFIYSPPQIVKPSSLSASCTNGVLTATWPKAEGAISYELRAGMNLTKEQILDGTTWENSHPTADDIVGRDLTSTSFSKSVGANNQSYTIWIQSKNQYEVSDRVFYQDKVVCAASVSVITPSSLSASCTNGVASLSWSGNNPKYALRVNNTTDGWNGTCSSSSGDFCNNEVTSTSYSFNASSGNYDFWLHGIDSQGNYTSPSSHYQFSCQGEQRGFTAPTNLSVSCSTDKQSATLSWNAVFGAVSYLLRADGEASYSKKDCGPHSICINNYPSNQITINTTPQSNIDFWVHGVDVNGNASGASEHFTFACN